MPDSSPNLLFIMTDQQRFDALSCHGGLAQTPHLDRLAAAGADLRRHFSNAPVCVPSRCAMFTSRYPHANGVMENDSRLSGYEEHGFATLKAHGYQLGYCGKNHLLHESETGGFDLLVTGDEPGQSPARVAYQALEQRSLQRLSETGSWASAEYHDFNDTDTTTGVITDAAIGYLDQAATDQPFCLTVSFSDPHAPHLAPRRFAERFPEDRIALPPQPPHGLDGKQPRLKIKQIAQGSLRASDADRRHYLGVYAAMCSFVDEQIGRLIAALERRPDADNTLIVFTSDHGDFGFHYNLCKKDLVLLDALLHVPCILHWPAHIPARTIDDQLSEHVDLMPTIFDLLGLEPVARHQGRSMRPWLTGADRPATKDAVFAEVCYSGMTNPYPDYETFAQAWHEARNDPQHPLHRSQIYNIPGEPTKTVRTSEWKYIWSATGCEELYHIAEDPLEWHNLASAPEHAHILAQLRWMLGEWHMRTENSVTPSEQRRRGPTTDWQRSHDHDLVPGAATSP